MTDLAIPGQVRGVRRRLDVSSDAALERIKRRYRAEARFRWYGRAAIIFAASFLTVLIFDILIKALPAFTQSRLQLDLNISTEHIDPAKPQAGDYDAVVRTALRSLFPQVQSRADRKALDSLLSSGAGDPLRRMVAAGPTIIGQTVKAPVLLSSDADLYLKGITTRYVQSAGVGSATPSGSSGMITIALAPGELSGELKLIQSAAADHAAKLLREASRLALAAQSAAADLKAAEQRLEDAKRSGDAAIAASYEAIVASSRSTKEDLEKKAELARSVGGALKKQAESADAIDVLDTHLPSLFLEMNGGVAKATSIEAGGIKAEVIVPMSSAASAGPEQWTKRIIETPEDSRKIRDREVAFLEQIEAKGVVERVPNFAFFTSGDSREPELAGILGSLVGSALTMLVTLALCLPLGVMAAIYLEEFAPKNRLTDIIEVNINNLAAVPSIVFGLLGLAMFLNFFGMPRSSPLVGGLVLALLVLPTIIIAGRAALKAVPPSIREAALGIGASKQQAVFHHVLPLAMPGILTGTIIGMAHALGETAPLLMIGMIAFIVDVPGRVTDAATVLPVQIFLWSDLPELGFQAKTAAAIIVLLVFLFAMNGLAIWLRKKFERRW